MPTAQRTRNAAHAEARLKALLGHGHISVRPHGKNLHIRLLEDDTETTVARLTETGKNSFTAAFCNHSGRWEPLPGVGALDDTIQLVVDCLEPYLQTYS